MDQNAHAQARNSISDPKEPTCADAALTCVDVDEEANESVPVDDEGLWPVDEEG